MHRPCDRQHRQTPLTPREIVARPTARHTPQQRMLAWAALKAERGQTIHQHRLLRAAIRRVA